MTDIAPKVDLKKLYKDHFTAPQSDFQRINISSHNYLSIDGEGDPNTATQYKEALESLYSLSYTLKFASKNQLGRDYVVAPLEGLWSAEDPEVFLTRKKSDWSWTMMILQPEWITADLVHTLAAELAQKKPLAALERCTFTTLGEGDSVQIMHIGSYDEEGPTLARLHDEYLPSHGLTFNGRHHEIYLGDPRKAAPEKLRTILRQPVKPLPQP